MCRKRVGLTGEHAGMKGNLMKRILELWAALVISCQIYVNVSLWIISGFFSPLWQYTEYLWVAETLINTLHHFLTFFKLNKSQLIRKIKCVFFVTSLIVLILTPYTCASRVWLSLWKPVLWHPPVLWQAQLSLWLQGWGCRQDPQGESRGGGWQDPENIDVTKQQQQRQQQWQHLWQRLEYECEPFEMSTGLSG